MFFKYLAENLKNKKLHYLILVACEISMLVISIIANGIMMDNVAKITGDDYEAKRIILIFKERYKLSDIREDYIEFCQKSPVPIGMLEVDQLRPNFGTYNYPSIICYLPDYSNVEEYFGKSSTSLPTQKQLDNREKVVLLGKGYQYDKLGDHQYTDENHILVGDDEEYLVVGEIPGGSYAIFFLGSEPDQTYSRGFDVMFSYYPTTEQQKEIYQVLEETVIKDREVEEMYLPDTQDLLDMRKSAASIILTAFVQLISVFNIMLIFKFMIDSRKKQFAVFRLCGFKKSACVVYSLCELIMTSALSAVISCVAVQLLKPALAKNYSIFNVMFGWDYLLILSAGFLIITALLFMIYISPSLKKSVSRELREM